MIFPPGARGKESNTSLIFSVEPGPARVVPILTGRRVALQKGVQRVCHRALRPAIHTPPKHLWHFGVNLRAPEEVSSKEWIRGRTGVHCSRNFGPSQIAVNLVRKARSARGHRRSGPIRPAPAATELALALRLGLLSNPRPGPCLRTLEFCHASSLHSVVPDLRPPPGSAHATAWASGCLPTLSGGFCCHE